MLFNYSKLAGKIKELFGTQSNFADSMGLSERGLSLKMNNKTPWKQTEIMRACELLNIPIEEVFLYFFCKKSDEGEIV